ncbi:MAG TPA: hypothetical protein VFV33_07720, partial [Gemmatimonadaceae bacterium]|nr:hypothetical protein [Gemmatimonadaceae bacterium]
MNRPKPKATFVQRLLRDHDHSGHGDDPSLFDPTAVEASLRGIGRLYGDGGYFPLDFQGWDHIPPAPTMLVMNHSGGTSIPDMWGFIAGWYRRFGVARPLYVLGHEMLFVTPGMRRYLG